jgi:hypothetical protein
VNLVVCVGKLRGVTKPIDATGNMYDVIKFVHRFCKRERKQRRTYIWKPRKVDTTQMSTSITRMGKRHITCIIVTRAYNHAEHRAKTLDALTISSGIHIYFYNLEMQKRTDTSYKKYTAAAPKSAPMPTAPV